MSMNIVLLEPEMPANTGNIGRTCVATGTKLHLIKPLGFEITDKMVKRAGLDYWPHLNYEVYENFEDFLEKNPDCIGKLYNQCIVFCGIFQMGKKCYVWCEK